MEAPRRKRMKFCCVRGKWVGSADDRCSGCRASPADPAGFAVARERCWWYLGKRDGAIDAAVARISSPVVSSGFVLSHDSDPSVSY